jgi:ribosomal peptide maturation radical SAM protein 1
MNRRLSALLISMPWAPFDEPSLGLGILCSKLESAGIHCQVQHFNLRLLRHLKPSSYVGIASEYGLNDFLFTRGLDGSTLTPVQEQILEQWAQLSAERDKGEYKPPSNPTEFKDYALKIRNEVVPEFLDECLASVLESDATMIGFTCMYDQTIPSLALARMIKDRASERMVVFGGYAMEGPVGRKLIECFPCVDVVAYGEGENKIQTLVEASVDRTLLRRIPRIEYRNADGSRCGNELDPGWIDLNESPLPNYRDYFLDVDRLASADQVIITPDTLPVESSRGCWWGRRSHCSFCGIDDKDLEYRAKTAEGVVAMLDTMSARYGITRFRFSDYILPRQYFRSVFPLLAQSSPPKYELHWEIKSNNRLVDIELMARAGVKDIQPGIESLSSTALRKMGKGVTAIQNLFTIKMLMQHGIHVHYNILYGFPDDEAQDYLAICKTIPLVYHLAPPHTYEAISVTRFSPIQKQYEQSGGLRASSHYNLVFSQEFLCRTGFKLEDYCYIFERPFANDETCQTLYGMMTYQIVKWSRAWENRIVELSFEHVDDEIVFRDSRQHIKPALTRLGGAARSVYMALSGEITAFKDLAQRMSTQLTEARVEEELGRLRSLGFVYEENGRYFGLAFPVSYYRDSSRGAGVRAEGPADEHPGPAGRSATRGTDRRTDEALEVDREYLTLALVRQSGRLE